MSLSGESPYELHAFINVQLNKKTATQRMLQDGKSQYPNSVPRMLKYCLHLQVEVKNSLILTFGGVMIGWDFGGACLKKTSTQLSSSASENLS